MTLPIFHMSLMDREKNIHNYTVHHILLRIILMLPIFSKSISPLNTNRSRGIMATAAFAAMLGACSPAQSNNTATKSAKTAEECVENHDALMTLSQNAFDQDIHGGWRTIADKDGCLGVAADLIQEFRETHEPTNRIFVLFWHEGQLRAELGQTAQALALFKQAYRPQGDNWKIAPWNYYADATIAYLERDRKALQAAHDRLYTLQKPDGWANYVTRYKEMVGTVPEWPEHANAVNSLIKCFEKPYSEVFGDDCYVPQEKATSE
jgi:hypothetical protein